jgi:hypothetical protein
MALKFTGGKAVDPRARLANDIDAGLERLRNAKMTLYDQARKLGGEEGATIQRKLNTIDQAINEAVYVARIASGNLTA